MPWNDTAQLNYMLPQVREAVIQTILHVARKFPIIRFDAAMTLAKKHYQRLWFPEPGAGGDIPTRAEHGMTREQFKAVFPEEFWREVVDRVAQEIPDTLLLAEAFWMMEGYFVRTLGMHRVYNSAFMNMLKMEHNDQYRSSIKNILEFNPEILKRFVNFVNNPDEETAEAQFGKGDKYIGVCIMMVTMPGLPMFGHGQIEGFTEKYGMEYRKAYRDEQVDQDLVKRHEREVFPLMHMRYLFSDVQHFYLYDFYTPQGSVNENVFAYSNSHKGQHGLVVYHNKFEETSGWIKVSAAYSVKVKEDERRSGKKNLGQAFGLHPQDNYFVIFREHLSGLEFIRRSREVNEQGMFVSLKAFQCQVFLDFREVEDNIWHHYANLESYLNGQGVPNIEEALKELFLMPLHQVFRQIVNKDFFEKTYLKRKLKIKDKLDEKLIADVSETMKQLLQEIKHYSGGIEKPEKVAEDFTNYFRLLLELPVFQASMDCTKNRLAQSALKSTVTFYSGEKSNWYLLFCWILVRHLGAVVSEEQVAEQSRAGLDEWLLQKILVQNLYDLGISHEWIERGSQLIKILTTHQDWWQVEVAEKRKPAFILEQLLKDGEVRDFLKINRYRDILWYNRERFQELLQWLSILAVLDTVLNVKKEPCKELASRRRVIQKIEGARKKSDYQVEKLMEELKG
jgi:hypothetical protein